MLLVKIQNPTVESYLHEHFKNNTKEMATFIADFLEKELIKKDIKNSFSEINSIILKKQNYKTLDSLIMDITPNNV